MMEKSKGDCRRSEFKRLDDMMGRADLGARQGEFINSAPSKI